MSTGSVSGDLTEIMAELRLLRAAVDDLHGDFRESFAELLATTDTIYDIVNPTKVESE